MVGRDRASCQDRDPGSEGCAPGPPWKPGTGRPLPSGLSFCRRKWSLGAEVVSSLLNQYGAFPATDRGSPGRLMSFFVGEGFKINNEFK